MNNSIAKLSLVLIVASVLCGCKADRGYVQREWSQSFRELGIVPVFPPREDVFVGDVYVYRFNPDSLKIEEIFNKPWKDLTDDEKEIRLEIGMSPRLARINLNEQIRGEYFDTLAAPATSPDYNGIVGNPALAQANDKIAAAEKKLQELKDIVSSAKKAAASAQKILVEKQREKAAADEAVKEAEDKLQIKKTEPMDTKAEEDALSAAKAAQLRAEKAYRDAKYQSDGAPADTALRENLRKADFDKNEATLNTQRAQEELNTKKATKDVFNEEKKLADTKTEQLAKAREVTTAQRKKEEADNAAKAEEDARKDLIVAATQEVDNAKKLRDIIAEEGVKLLYAQPADAKWDVFTGVTRYDQDNRLARVNRFRIVGFPEFYTVSFTQGDLSALVPIEAMGLGLNVSHANIKKVSIKVPAAESYGLSTNRVFNQLLMEKVDCGATHWTLSKEARGALLPAARYQTNLKPESGTTVCFRVITEAFYARALDISIFSSDEFGARAQVVSPLPSAGVLTNLKESPDMFKPAQQVDLNAPDTLSHSAAALSDLQSRLGITPALPGGAMQFVRHNEKSIGLRRVFDRPVAIGFRGFTIEYDVKTDTILNIMPARTWTPKKIDLNP